MKIVLIRFFGTSVSVLTADPRFIVKTRIMSVYQNTKQYTKYFQTGQIVRKFLIQMKRISEIIFDMPINCDTTSNQRKSRCATGKVSC